MITSYHKPIPLRLSTYADKENIGTEDIILFSHMWGLGQLTHRFEDFEDILSHVKALMYFLSKRKGILT